MIGIGPDRLAGPAGRKVASGVALPIVKLAADLGNLDAAFKVLGCRDKVLVLLRYFLEAGRSYHHKYQPSTRIIWI